MNQPAKYLGASAPFFSPKVAPTRTLSEGDLFKWQTVALARAKALLWSIIEAQPGSGKTFVGLLWAVWYLEQLENKGRILIVAPSIVLEDSWLVQIFQLVESAGLKVLPTHRYSGKDRAALWASHEADVLTCTPDTLPKMLEAMNDAGRLFVTHAIIDEAHMFKGPTTKRGEAARALSRAIPTLLMTGTLMPNGELDAWSPGYIASRGEGFFGLRFDVWRSKYFRQVGDYRWVPLPGTQDLIRAALKKVAISAPIDRDESGLPQEVYLRSRFEFSRAHTKALETFLTERRIDTPWGELVYPEEADSAYLHKLRQLSSGFIYHEGATHLFDDARLKALDNIVHSVADGVLVVTHYRAEAALIKARFGALASLLTGETPDARRPEIIDAFNAGAVKVLVAHPAAMGLGIHLGRGDAKTIVWFSGGFDLAQRIQTNARMIRTGQRHSVTVIDLYSDVGIDRALEAVIQRKGAVEADILKALRGVYV